MEIVDLLKQAPLFSEMNKADLEELVPSTRVEAYEPGRVILREGRVGAAFFLIVSGTVEVIKALGKPEERVVAERGAGDFFGEIALIAHTPRNATITTTSAARALVITDRAFRQLLDRQPQIAVGVLTALAERLAPTTL